MASLTIQVPDQESIDVALDGFEQLSVGRGPDNDVVLDHASMSSAHAIIRNIDGVFTINDLGSTNGTFVDGEQVVEGNLVHGSQITLGSVQAVFVENGTAAVAADTDAGANAHGAPVADIADVSNAPADFVNLSPIEKVEAKDVIGLTALIVGLVALVAALAVIGLSVAM